MSNKTTIVIRGKASYAKLLGDPVLNYNKDGKEWKMDIKISKETAKEMKGFGLADRVKMKADYLDGEPYLSFKQPEFKRDGKRNKPIAVYNILGKPWDQETLIGNDSDIEIKFQKVDYGPGKKSGAYLRSVRILKLVPYQGSSGFATVDENDEFYQEALKAEAANAEAMAQAANEELRADLEKDALNDELPPFGDDEGDEEEAV